MSVRLQELLREYQDLPEFTGECLTSAEQRGRWNSAPLHIAVYRENPEEIATLLEAGADVNAAGEYGERPVQIAINCKNADIIKLLLSAGASLELTDGNGRDAWAIAEIVHFSDRLRQVLSQGGT